MIDTDKYEGHTEGPWAWDNVGVLQGEESVLWVDFLEPDPDWQLNNSAIHVSEKDEELIADAPLILEAYKRLREALKMCEYDIEVTPIMLRDLIEDCLEEYGYSPNQLTVGNLLKFLDELQKDLEEEIDCCADECCGCGGHECCPQQQKTTEERT